MTDPYQQFVYEARPSPFLSLRDYLAMIFRHKWKAVGFALLVMVVSVVAVATLKDPYRSEAKLLVRPGWESMNVDPTATTSESTGPMSQPQAVLLNTMLDIVQGRALAEKVVDRIGPARLLEGAGSGESGGSDPVGGLGESSPGEATGAVKKILGLSAGREVSARDEAVKFLLENTEAEVVPRTQIISIAFTSPDPRLSQEVVQELTNLCLEQHKLVYRNPGSYRFLEEQEREARAEVEGTKAALQELKKETGFTSVGSRLETLEENLGLLEQEIARDEAAMAASEVKIESLKKRLTLLPERQRTGESTSLDYSVINSLREQIHTLQSEKMKLLSKFTKDFDGVKDIDLLIEEVQAALDREKPLEVRTETWAINEVYQAMDSSLCTEEMGLESLRVKTEKFRDLLAESRKEQTRLIALEFQFAQLEQELGDQQARYAKVFEKAGQARMEQALEEKRISNISVVLQPTAPLDPEKSRKKTILLLGFLGGILGGIGLTFLLEYLDHTLKTPEEIERRVELPTLVTIPRIREYGFNVKQRL